MGSVNPHQEWRQRQGKIASVHQPASLAEWMSSRFRETLSQKLRWKATEEDTQVVF